MKALGCTLQRLPPIPHSKYHTEFSQTVLSRVRMAKVEMGCHRHVVVSKAHLNLCCLVPYLPPRNSLVFTSYLTHLYAEMTA
jgi:hypothetical protein